MFDRFDLLRTEQKNENVYTYFDYPDIEIDGMYGTFQRQYETHKSALEKYPEFEHLKHEDNTPKTEGELFYPEMHYENKLKDLQKQVSDMRYNAELNSNSTKSSGSSIINNDMSINQDNYAENGDNILNAEFGSKENYTAVRRMTFGNSENRGMQKKAAAGTDDMRDGRGDVMKGERNISNTQEYSRKSSQNQSQNSFEIQYAVEYAGSNDNQVKARPKSVSCVINKGNPVKITGRDAEYYLKFINIDVSDKEAGENIDVFGNKLGVKGLIKVRVLAETYNYDPTETVLKISKIKSILEIDNKYSEMPSEDKDNLAIFISLHKGLLNNTGGNISEKERSSLDRNDGARNAEAGNSETRNSETRNDVARNDVARKSSQSNAEMTSLKNEAESRIFEINSKNPRNFIVDLTDNMSSNNLSKNPATLRRANVEMLEQYTNESEEYIEDLINSKYSFFANSDNRKETNRIIKMYPDVFKSIRDSYGSYNIKELHETCAAISACEYIDVREKYRRICAPQIEKSLINFKQNEMVKRSHSLDELPERYASVIADGRKDGKSDSEIHAGIVRLAEAKTQFLEVQIETGKRLQEIMLGNDKYYNIDAVFEGMLYNVANFVGIFPGGDEVFDSSYLTAQRAMNKAAELADKAGMSRLGVDGGRFVRDYTVSIGFLVASIFTGGATASFARYYTIMDSVVKVRTRYNELKEQGVDDDTLYRETIKYAMEIGGIETIGSLCGHAFAKGIIKDFAKNETILNAGSEIMGIYG